MAVASREAEEKRLGRTIHTEVFPATQFFEGEGYHQARCPVGVGVGARAARGMPGRRGHALAPAARAAGGSTLTC